MSATLPVVGSQLIPYHLEQQSVPVHVLKIPKYGSFKEDLKANKASRSDAGQELTVAEITAKKRQSDINKTPIFHCLFLFLFLCIMYKNGSVISVTRM